MDPFSLINDITIPTPNFLICEIIVFYTSL